MEIIHRRPNRGWQVQIDVDEIEAESFEAVGRVRENADVEVQVRIAMEELSNLLLYAMRWSKMRAHVLAVSRIILERLEYVEKVQLGIAFFFADQPRASALEDAGFCKGARERARGTSAYGELEGGRIG